MKRTEIRLDALEEKFSILSHEAGEIREELVHLMERMDRMRRVLKALEMEMHDDE